MVGIYYSNGWDSKSLPFMSTRLLSEDGTKYPITKVFVDGVLDTDALNTYGIPRLTGTFAYAMFMTNAAVSTQPFTNLSSFLLFLDWRPGCALCPLLGRRHPSSVQKRQKRFVQ